MKINNNKNTLYTNVPYIGRINITAASYGIIDLQLQHPVNSQQIFSFMEKNRCDLMPVTPENKIHYEISQQICQYLTGKRWYFDVAIGILISVEQKKILDIVQQIPYGQMMTYDQLADRLGNSKLKTKTSSALLKNPLPLIIPCHRVIESDDDVGSYTWGRKIKQRLLTLESKYYKHSNNNYSPEKKS